MTTLNCAIDPMCAAVAAMAAAQTTVPVMAPSLARSRANASRSRATLSVTAEGLQEGLALGLGQVGGDQLAVVAVEPLPEPVDVGVVGDQEQRGGAGCDLGADPLQVLLGDSGPVGPLRQDTDPGTDDRPPDRDAEKRSPKNAPDRAPPAPPLPPAGLVVQP